MGIRRAILHGARSWTRRGRRGGWLVINTMRQLGLLRSPLRIMLDTGGAVTLPVAIVRDYYDAVDLQTYEADLVASIHRVVSTLPRPRYLLEGGGHIGMLSVLLLRDGLFDGGWLVEPNRDLFPYLAENARPYRATTINAAVADYRGRGRLAHPTYDNDATACFLVDDQQGDVDVIRFDDLAVPADGATVAIKLDVEGGELAAFKGALATIRTARHLVVAFEAHAKVNQRTGIDPVEIIAFLNSVRPMRFSVVGKPDLSLKLDRALFAQLPPGIYNIVGQSV